MNFFVIPREIREINQWGRGQNKLRGGGASLQKSQKLNVSPPVYFEPESIEMAGNNLRREECNSVALGIGSKQRGVWKERMKRLKLRVETEGESTWSSEQSK